MLRITVDASADAPPSRQVVDAVMDAIARGELETGDRLPSVRDVAVAAMVNPNTVSKAYRELGLRGIVVAKNGSGVFVTDEGGAIAHEARHGATLDDYRRAVRAALSAGHRPHDLEAELTRLAGAPACMGNPRVPEDGGRHE